VVLHIHPVEFVDYYQGSGRIVRSLIGLILKLSDQVVLLSEGIRERFSVLRRDEVVVIPNPVDIAEFRRGPKAAPPCDKLLVLYMGWIVREKGVYDLVEAIPGVVAAVPAVRFVFAGNKEIKRLRSLLAVRKLDGVATVAGWVSGAAKIDLIAASHVLVLPSYSEGVPNVLLEAMASGLPVIATPVGGVPSIVEHGATGIFVTPGDVSGLVSAIVDVLRDPPLRARLAEAALANVTAYYSLEHISGLLEASYARYFDGASSGRI